MRLGDLDALKEQIKNAFKHNFNGCDALLVNEIYEFIDNAPTIPLPDFKEGYKQAIIDGKTNYSRPHWIKIFENPYTNGYVCSVCGHEIHVTEQFLPKVTECEGCGADMRKGGTE